MASAPHKIINWIKDCPALKGYVKDQQQRCNCWALAVGWGVGARNGLKRRIGVKGEWLLSAQYLMDDFIRDRPNDIPSGSNGRRARDIYNNYPLDTSLALDYIVQNGIPYESHYPYTGARDCGAEKRDTSKFPKVFINGYTRLQSTNVGPAAKEIVYGALLRGPLLASIDMSFSFTRLKGDQVLRPEDVESSGSEFNPGSDDPSTDDPTDTNDFSNDDPTDTNDSRSISKSSVDDPSSHESGIHESSTGSHRSGSYKSSSHESVIPESSNHKSGSHEAAECGSHDSGSRESGSHESGSHESVSHESGSPDSVSHESGSQDSGSHESSSHASDDAGNPGHAIVIVGMDFDENYFMVLNSQGVRFGVNGVGNVDCSLVFDILEPHVNDDRNRGMRGPAFAYSSKQQRALKHLGKGRDISMDTLETIGGNVSAMGPGIEKASTGIMLDVLKCLGHSEKHIQECTLIYLVLWLVHVHLEKMHVTHSPKYLRVPGSVDEPIDAAWRWVYDVIGDSRCPISGKWLQTEMGGFMMEHLQLLTRTSGDRLGTWTSQD